MINLEKVESIAKNLGLKLVVEDNAKKQNRHKFYVIDENGNKNSILKDVKFKDHDIKKDILFCYLEVRAWWGKYNRDLYAHFAAKSSLKNKDAITWGKFDIHDVNDILESFSKHREIFDNKVSNKKSKTSLTSTQAKSIKELCDYECDSCGVNINRAIEEMPEFRDEFIKAKDSLIQIHHMLVTSHKNRNHIKYLIPLCCICHGEQKGHGHGFQQGDAKGAVAIKTIRKFQGIE